MPNAVDGTILHLEGGTSTVIRLPIGDLTNDLTAARQEGIEFLFIQSPTHGDNGYVVDPKKVVALSRTNVRT